MGIRAHDALGQTGTILLIQSGEGLGQTLLLSQATCEGTEKTKPDSSQGVTMRNKLEHGKFRLDAPCFPQSEVK